MIAHFEGEVVELVGGKARDLHGDLVGAGPEQRQGVLAGAIGDGDGDDAGVDLGSDDLGLCDDAAAGVFDRSGNGAAGDLGERRWGGGQAEEEPWGK
jgi:hypothetical protein